MYLILQIACISMIMSSSRTKKIVGMETCKLTRYELKQNLCIASEVKSLNQNELNTSILLDLIFILYSVFPSVQDCLKQ